MTNVGFASIAEYRDIETLNHVEEALALGAAPGAVLEAVRPISRDNARTPMQWDASEHAGFTTGTPWIGVNPNHREINAEAAAADPGSVFHHYRRLHERRHTLPVVVDGRFTLLLPEHEQVFAYTRVLDGALDGGGDALLVVANMSSGAAPG